MSDTRQLRKDLAALVCSDGVGTEWDLVLCHRYRAYWAVTGTTLAARPCVVLAHEYGLLDRWQRRINRRLFARSFHFAGVAPGVAAELAQRTGSASVLPNVMDVDAAVSALLPREAACDVLGISSQALNIGVVGRLHYKKRPQMAAQTYQQFSESHPQAQLVFVGDGDRAELGTYGEQDGVHLTGAIPDAYRTFSAFDVLLHTGCEESFGMVVLEAMCAGVPVVALEDKGPGYVLGELGFFAQSDTPQGFADALALAVQTDKEEFARRARQRARRNYSIASLARALDHLLTEQGAPSATHTPRG